MSITLNAPFPWFGGKSRAAGFIWDRLGDVAHYVEPFAGSLAVLLGRPTSAPRQETCNDLDGFVSNFWRALAADPDAVERFVSWPINENDLHARHAWLLGQRDSLTARLEGDPDFYDARIAGWWAWGISLWIGSGWCTGNGPWQSVNGALVKIGRPGVKRQIPAISAIERGVLLKSSDDVAIWLRTLQERIRKVRVASGDWRRVLTPAVLGDRGPIGIMLDPPYTHEDRYGGLYATDTACIAQDVRQWALEHGDDPRMRIALCGYEGEHAMPGWTKHKWKAAGGYGVQRKDGDNENAARETVWFSPHCMNRPRYETRSLFGEVPA